jgi:hypothetical protein
MNAHYDTGEAAQEGDDIVGRSDDNVSFGGIVKTVNDNETLRVFVNYSFVTLNVHSGKCRRTVKVFDNPPIADLERPE